VESDDSCIPSICRTHQQSQESGSQDGTSDEAIVLEVRRGRRLLGRIKLVGVLVAPVIGSTSPLCHEVVKRLGDVLANRGLATD
jgi:hypothetical protein